ncbi:hypothetical protein KP509_27G063800 [Ceratopteris richardii]|uniref:Uncharacterized protein n=1 Tax=Ceratopteris richardii TaxID=49495 RepID=A0A8T2RJM1_CERRI|nr:hypothetical protein KP509_27G063800 [Ceratopteris richardii]
MEDVQLSTEAKSGESDAGVSDEGVPLTVRKLMMENEAVCRNFEHLKQLFLKLLNSNTNLKETSRRLQSDKVQNISGDSTLEEKEAIELEYIKLVSMKGEENMKAGDLADKCKYLEMDLETAYVAGEAAHGQLLRVAYEKDAIILDLEKVIQRLEENIRILEEERQADYKSWNKERKELTKMMEDIERDKANHIEMCQTLKCEIADLHGMLNAMERSTQDAEIRHANAIEYMKEENSLIKTDLDKARKDLKLAKESVLRLQKEIAEMHEEAAGLRAQLQDALNDAHQYQQSSINSTHANEQLRKSLLGAQENIAELIRARKEDEILHLQQLKDSQMAWEMQRTQVFETATKDCSEKIFKLEKQNQSLKKRLKQSYEVLAVMSCDCERLKEELKEKAILLKEGERILEPPENLGLYEKGYSNCVERRDGSPLSLIANSPTYYNSMAWPLHADMTQLADRQMKVLDSLVTT